MELKLSQRHDVSKMRPSQVDIDYPYIPVAMVRVFADGNVREKKVEAIPGRAGGKVLASEAPDNVMRVYMFVLRLDGRFLL